MLFHRCILLARGVYQDCSVAMHHNSSVEMSQTAQTSLADVTVSDKVEETKAEVEGQLKETSRLIAECYLGLAKCVLNGQGRTQQDYRRAAQYCDNVSTTTSIFMLLRCWSLKPATWMCCWLKLWHSWDQNVSKRLWRFWFFCLRGQKWLLLSMNVIKA